MVPVPVPSCRNSRSYRVSPVSVHIEFQLTAVWLQNTKLVRPLGDESVGLNVLFGLYPEFNGQLIAVQVEIRMAVEFHPVVMSRKADCPAAISFHESGPPHYRRIIAERRRVGG